MTTCNFRQRLPLTVLNIALLCFTCLYLQSPRIRQGALAATAQEAGCQINQTSKILGRVTIYSTEKNLRIDVPNRELSCVVKEEKVFLLNRRTQRLCSAPLKGWKPQLASSLMTLTGNQGATDALTWQRAKAQDFQSISCDKVIATNKQATILIGRALPQLAEAGHFVMRFNGMPLKSVIIKNGLPLGLTYTDTEQGNQIILSTQTAKRMTLNSSLFEIPTNFKIVKDESKLDDFIE